MSTGASACVKVTNRCFFFSSRRRHTRCWRDWSSDVCSSDLRELSPYGVVVDHDDSGVVGGGIFEGFPCALDIRVLDVPDHAEVPKAPGDRAARDAVGRVEARYDHTRHLQGRAEILGDVPGVPGVLEVVSLLAEQAADVAGHGPEPADVVVAGDDDVGRDLPDLR